MKALALDFDGVVCQSAREAFAVALRARAGLLPEAPLAVHAADPAPERPANAALWSAFLDAMPLGNRAEDYAVVLDALEAGVPLPDQAAYDAFRATRDPGRLDAFHERFYAVRAAWRERDPAGWLRWSPVHPEVAALLRRRAGEVRLAIATAKDAASVHALLEEWGLADLFAPERILDKETGVSKRAHLEALQRRLALPFAEITFVDDKLNHLESVAPLGVRCVLAGWGYNGERERRAARRAGFPVLGLGDAEARLFG